MSLFIGGLSVDVHTKDLQETFGLHGHITRCDIKGTFAFITYEDERDAEDAIEAHNNKQFFDQKINVEWAKGSGRYDPRSDRPHGERPKRDDRCFDCGERGHRAVDCRRRGSRGGGGGRYSSRRRSRSRSRSPRRSPRRERSKDRSRSPRKDRERDRSRDRDRGDKRERSRSGSRDRKERRSRDEDRNSRGRDSKTSDKPTDNNHTEGQNSKE